MTDEGRAWLKALALPHTAREQVTIALVMIDKLDAQLAPIDKELRAYARRQPGCKALMGAAGSRQSPAATSAWTASTDRAAAMLTPQRDHPINHHVAEPTTRQARGPR